MKKLDWPKIVLVSIPVTVIVGFFIFFILLSIMENKEMAIWASIALTLLSVIFYFFLCIKFSSSLKVELEEELCIDQSIGNKSFLELTGQKFKINLIFNIVILCGIICFFDDKLGVYFKTPAENIFNASLIFGLFTVLVIGFFLRCPECKKNLLWYAIKSKDRNAWSQWLLVFSVCPYCDFRPVDIENI